MLTLTEQLQRAIRQTPQATAVIDHNQTDTWEAFGARVMGIAEALRAAGVAPGDRVTVLAGNSSNYLACYFAIPWVGAITLPLNSRLSQSEMEYILQDADARVVLTDDEFREQADALLDADTPVSQILSLSEANAWRVSEDHFWASQPVSLEPTDVAALFYTGGTTGAPKGVMLTHGGLINGGIIWAQCLKIPSDESILIALPMFHLAAGLSALGGVFLGAQVAIEPRFDPPRLLERIEALRISMMVFVPAVLDMLIRTPEFNDFDTSSLKRISYGGAPMPAPILERALEALPGVAFYQIYGQTECGGMTSCLEPRYHTLDGPDASKRNTAGKVAIGMDFKICDPESGDDLPPGTPGEVVIRGPSLTPGYWRAPDKTRDLFRDGWMRTGDVGRVDEEGFLTIVDRVKDMIISGGENIFAGEVENVLYTHAAIEECAIIGLPDDKWGERVHAVIRLKSGETLSADAIMEYCRGRIADYKVVRSVDFTDEALPRSPINKVLKRVLRDRYMAKTP